MFASNLTIEQSVTHEACEFMRQIKWRNAFATQSVYTNILITCVFNAVVFPFSTILNGAFILCVFLNRPLRNQKSIVLLAFLAITDLLVGAVIQPMFVGSAVCRLTQTCKFSETISSAVCFLVAICACSSFFHTSLVACDRYVAIQHALRYKVIVTTNKLRIGSVVAWIFSVLLVCMFSFFSDTQKIVLAVLSILFALNAYFYKAICLESRRLSRRINVLTPHQGVSNLNQKRQLKAVKTTVLIFGCLSVCYGPTFFAHVIFIFILPMNPSNVSEWLCVFLWTRTLMMVNSLCNALIYQNRVPRFRKTIQGLFKTNRRTATNSQQPDTRRPMNCFDRAQSNCLKDGIPKITRDPPFISNNETGEKSKVTEHLRPVKNAENLQDDVESSMNNFKLKKRSRTEI